MTLQFPNAAQALKFAKKCVYQGCCANALVPVFSTVTFHAGFYQVEVKTEMSVDEMKAMLNDLKIKFKWVSQF